MAGVPRLGVVTNPNALGVARDRALVERLQALVGDAGRVVETPTPAEIGETLRGFRTDGCEIVGICGGDGTNLATVTSAIEVWGADRLPRFAILRGGTVNTVAGNLGIRGRPEAVMARLLAALRAGHVRTIAQDVLGVNERFGFLFSACMGARFFDAYYGGPMVGLPWAGLLAARIAGSALAGGPFAARLFAPARAELSVDDEPPAPRKLTLVVAATVPDVGLAMRVAWRAHTEPGRFHIVASGLPAGRLAAQLPRVLAGAPLRGEPHLDRLARRATLRFDETQSYVLDGDLFRARELFLAIGPRLRILVA